MTDQQDNPLFDQLEGKTLEEVAALLYNWTVEGDITQEDFESVLGGMTEDLFTRLVVAETALDATADFLYCESEDPDHQNQVFENMAEAVEAWIDMDLAAEMDADVQNKGDMN